MALEDSLYLLGAWLHPGGPPGRKHSATSLPPIDLCVSSLGGGSALKGKEEREERQALSSRSGFPESPDALPYVRMLLMLAIEIGSRITQGMKTPTAGGMPGIVAAEARIPPKREMRATGAHFKDCISMFPGSRRR